MIPLIIVNTPAINNSSNGNSDGNNNSNGNNDNNSNDNNNNDNNNSDGDGNLLILILKKIRFVTGAVYLYFRYSKVIYKTNKRTIDLSSKKEIIIILINLKYLGGVNLETLTN
jgi:hypothetical protein